MTVRSDSSLVTIPLQGLPVAAAMLDHDGAIVAANRRFTRLCGRADGRRFTDLIAEQDRPIVDEALSGLMLIAERVAPSCRIRALRAKPPSLWLAIDVVSLGPAAPAAYVACLSVIPTRRRIDRPPAPITPDARRWPPLLMTLSHELRGPLTAIRGWAQMAERGVLPSEKMSRALTVIGRNATSLADMVENLFDLSRRATGSLALKRGRLDLNPLAQLVVDSIAPAARARDVILTWTGTRVPLLIDGDPFRLEQVVRNLVENALKFTPAGGHVHVHTGGDEAFAEVVVTDNGSGISPALLPVIFEPFRHDDAGLHPTERGLGLGLALVRELVQLHGGSVRALSEGKGRGSTFIVRLPLIHAAGLGVAVRHASQPARRVPCSTSS